MCKALVLSETGERSKAQAVLSGVLKIASRKGYVWSLLKEGEPLRDLLKGYSASRKAAPAVRSYLKSLLLKFEAEEFSKRQGPLGSCLDASAYLLTPRELEVLNLLNVGLSRQEIADALCISLNTVKKHLANIYSKMGVSTREEAVGKTL